ncbi:MAG TPA: hypothetical protein VL172_06690 [Kofleriaceae bacterium]|nr:hypothetical protein [Kofleriaceae bacterium]
MKIWSIAIPLCLTAGCVSPKDRFDEFNDRVIDAAPVVIVDGTPLAQIPDVTGEFLQGYSPVFAPAASIQFRTTVGYMAVSDTSGRLDMSAQPLDADTREPVGDPVVTNDTVVNEAGEFAAIVQGNVDGAANPITGSDLVLDIVLHGIIRNTDLFCGTVTGNITNLDLVLDGSTFGSIRIADDTATADLPPPLVACPDETPDAGP